MPATGVKKGSLVVISSGPQGKPGINPQLMGDARLRKSYDIIGYDPRSMGQSTPKITCQLAENNETLSQNSNDIPAAELQVRKMINACIKATGTEILQHMGTYEAVNDLNLILPTCLVNQSLPLWHIIPTALKRQCCMLNAIRRKPVRWY